MSRRGRRGRPRMILRGATAAVTLAVLVVGLPLALYRLGGNPIPANFEGPLFRGGGRIICTVSSPQVWPARASKRRGQERVPGAA